MAKQSIIYIMRDEDVLYSEFEERQSEWLEEHHPDKSVIACEAGNQVIINEENTAMMCMEYVEE